MSQYTIIFGENNWIYYVIDNVVKFHNTCVNYLYDMSELQLICDTNKKKKKIQK